MKSILPALLLGLGMPLAAIQITSGTINFDGILLSASFSFATSEWEATGLFQIGQNASCSPCRPGESVMVSGQPGGSSWFDGTVTKDGVTHSVAWFNSPTRLFFSNTESILVTGPGVYTAPFTLEGVLCGANETGNDPPCPHLSAVVTGAGTVEVTLVEEPPGPLGAQFHFDSAVFTFEAPPIAETPEPSAIVSTGTGLLAASWLRRRHGRDRSASPW